MQFDIRRAPAAADRQMPLMTLPEPTDPQDARFCTLGGTGLSGAPAEMQSLRNRYPIGGRDWSAAGVAAAADAVAEARDTLLTAIEDSFGADTLEATGRLLGRQRAE